MGLNSKQQARASVEAALDWAYRQSYCYALRAAEDYCHLTGRCFEVESLGQYGDKLVFSDAA